MMNIIQMLAQIKSNPQAVLSQYGIPKEVANNPQEAVQYLMNAGRVSQEQYNNAVKTAQSMGFKI